MHAGGGVAGDLRVKLCPMIANETSTYAYSNAMMTFTVCEDPFV